jgi:hypothetical protein
MKKQIIMIMMLQFSYHLMLAKQNFGARLTAMGMNSAAVTDEWNITGNPAGMSLINTPTLALNYLKYISGTDLSNQAIAFIFPLKKSTIGICLNKYGISQFNEITVGAALSKKFGNQFSLALKINYHQIKISDYGSIIGFSIDVGTIYVINQKLIIGLYLNNPAFQKFSSNLISISIPSAIYTGISYEISNKILLATTISKHISSSLGVGLGIDYKLIKSLSLRTGLTLKPFKQYVGVGLSYKALLIDFTVESDPFLSYKPQLGLSYAF